MKTFDCVSSKEGKSQARMKDRNWNLGQKDRKEKESNFEAVPGQMS